MEKKKSSIVTRADLHCHGITFFIYSAQSCSFDCWKLDHVQRIQNYEQIFAVELFAGWPQLFGNTKPCLQKICAQNMLKIIFIPKENRMAWEIKNEIQNVGIRSKYN